LARPIFVDLPYIKQKLPSIHTDTVDNLELNRYLELYWTPHL